MACVILLPIVGIPIVALVEWFKTKEITLHEIDGEYCGETRKQENGISKN